MWIMTGNFKGLIKLWNGHGWTVDMEEAKKFEDPDEAQRVADSLHIADCSFDVAKARETVFKSHFVVGNVDSGKVYEPPPLIKNRFIFDREKRRKE